MKLARFKAYNEQNVDLDVLVAASEVVMIVEGTERLGDAKVCNIFLRHGVGCVVYGTATEVEQTLLESGRLN